MSDSQKLLTEYIGGSEAAFREIVERYVHIVYSTAARLVGGDTHLAQDIAQTVFLDLARAAKSLSRHPQLAGWLHRHTCFVASKAIRSQRRREIREREAAQMNAVEYESNFRETAHILDAAINQLGATDRSAIILRFFEDLDFRAIGQALGSTEAAAQKRVRRALEKLNHILTKKGVKLGATTLAVALSAHAVSAAPAGLAANIATSVLIAAPGSVSAFSLVKIMTLSKTKSAALALIIVASITAPFVFNRPAAANVARLEQEVAIQTTQLLAIARQNNGLASQIQAVDQTTAREREELSSLSAEAGLLRAREAEEKSLRSQIHQLGLQRDGGNGTTWQNREMWLPKRKRADAWAKAFFTYANAHGQLPSTFEDAESFFPKDIAKGSLSPSEEYEILYHGSLQTLTNLNPDLHFIIFRERKLSPSVHLFDNTYYKKMARFDIHANGTTTWSSVLPGQLDSEFNSYEKENLVPDGVQ